MEDTELVPRRRIATLGQLLFTVTKEMNDDKINKKTLYNKNDNNIRFNNLSELKRSLIGLRKPDESPVVYCPGSPHAHIYRSPLNPSYSNNGKPSIVKITRRYTTGSAICSNADSTGATNCNGSNAYSSNVNDSRTITNGTCSNVGNYDTNNFHNTNSSINESTSQSPSLYEDRPNDCLYNEQVSKELKIYKNNDGFRFSKKPQATSSIY